MWLGFYKSDWVGGELVVKDKSTNSNNAKLFTGKALSFNGNDSVDVGNTLNVGTNDFSILFWIRKLSSGTSTQRVIDKRNTKGYTLYLDSSNILRLELNDGTGNVGFVLGTLADDTYQRVAVSVDRNGFATCYIDGVAQTPVDVSSKQGDLDDPTSLFIGADAPGGTTLGLQGEMSDVQFLNTVIGSDDVTFDYNNPNHLVTDNPNTTLTLSNLSAYYALSEGSGSIAYDSSTPLGSEEVVNGDFSNNFTSWTNGSDWSIVSSAAHLTNSDSETNSTLTSDTSLTSTLSYKATYTISDYTSGELALVLGNVSIPSTNGTHTVIFSGQSSFSVKRKGGATDLTIDNVSIKLVSVGDITGATHEDQQPTIPQLGLMDWAKSTIASNEVTLIQAPNNKGYDILGNSLRLRERGFNLDGSGYAEVADDNSLDFGTGDFTIETWLKASYLSGGSTLNSTISLGGDLTALDSAGIGVYSVTSKFAGYVGGSVFYSNNAFNSGNWYHVLITRDSGLCTMYVDSVAQTETVTSNNSITNSVVKNIGRDVNSNRFYSNLIDEPRLYKRPLTQDEVINNYKVGLNAHKVGSAFSTEFSSEFGF
tara:strand:+ start:182 stop:1960 length:1779 start_codon:yes stop_codon:yes gene_type:complete